MNVKLCRPSAPDLEGIRRLYLDAFPPAERRPWESISAGGSTPLLMAIKSDDDALLGLLSFWDFVDFVYIEHLAVDPAQRGAGVGAAALKLLRESCGRPLLLEVEPPADDNPTAARRIAFYRRNGFDVLPYPYIQPPYAPGLPPVPLLLMATDTAIDPAAATALLHNHVYTTN